MGFTLAPKGQSPSEMWSTLKENQSAAGLGILKGKKVGETE